MSQYLQRKYKIPVSEEIRQNARQNEGPVSGAERAWRWRESCKSAKRGVNVGANSSK
jgi:hypothetical protein